MSGDRGNTEDGFNRTARDLDAAITNACFSSLEHFLIGKARFASYALATLSRRKGEPEPRPLPFRLDVKALAPVAGCNEESLGRAHKRLVGRRVFRPAPGHPGLYLINKDYGTWVDPDGGKDNPPPLLSRAQVEDADRTRDDLRSCVAGWATVAEPRREKARKARGTPDKNVGTDRQNCRHLPTKMSEIADKKVDDGDKIVGSPIEERADLESSESIKSKQSVRAGLAPPSGGKTSPPSKPLPSGPAAPPADDDAAGRIARRIAARFDRGDDSNLDYYRTEARMWLAGQSAEVVELAVSRAEASTNSSTGLAFCRFVPSKLATAAKDVGQSRATAPGPRYSGVPSIPLPPSDPEEIGGIPVADLRAAMKASKPMWYGKPRGNAS